MKAHRADAVVFPNWNNYRGKEEARNYALQEQRHICAFCQGPIVNNPRRMKLAHVVPRDCDQDGPRLELSWINIVGSRPGGEDTGKPQIHHCDTLQGNRPICSARDPVQFVNDSLSYDWDGGIYSDDPEVDRVLDEVLGLRSKPVVRRRMAAMDELEKMLSEGLDREAERQKYLELLDAEQTNEAPLLAYADFLRWHLRQGKLSV